MNKLREIQESLKKERLEYEKHGIKVVVNGKLEVEDIKLNHELSPADQEKHLKECLNEAMKKIQMNVAQKMAASGGLGF